MERSNTKDILCKIIENFLMDKNRDCHIRHCYENVPFKIIKGIKEMKGFKPKVLITPDSKDTRYRYRSLWLCYEITENATCEICGRLCSKDKLLPVMKIRKNGILSNNFSTSDSLTVTETKNICPRCAYVLDYNNNPDSCLNCTNRICGTTLEDFKERVKVKKELDSILKSDKNSGHGRFEVTKDENIKKKKRRRRKRSRK